MNQKILIFDMDMERRDEVRRIALRLKIQPVDVEKEEYGQSLGYLAGISGFKPMQGKKKPEPGIKNFNREMIVFSGVNSECIDEFLVLWKAAGQKPIERKAVLTPVNIFWSSEKLLEELAAEHAAMKR